MQLWYTCGSNLVFEVLLIHPPYEILSEWKWKADRMEKEGKVVYVMLTCTICTCEGQYISRDDIISYLNNLDFFMGILGLKETSYMKAHPLEDRYPEWTPNLHSDRSQDSNPCARGSQGLQSADGSIYIACSIGKVLSQLDE